MEVLKAIVAVGLLLVVSLSGCLEEELEPSGIRSGIEVTEFGNYTWAKSLATDGYGNILADHPFLRNAEAAPFGVYQLLPKAGPEPSIGVTKKGNIFVSTMDQVQRSSDNGKTWKVVYDYNSYNFPTSQDTFFTLDPLLYVDPDTDRIFVAHLQVLHAAAGLPWCIYLAWSQDEGETWSDQGPGGFHASSGVQSCMIPLSDHQKLVTAKMGPKTSEQTKQLLNSYPNKYQNLVYYCHNKFDPTAGLYSFVGEADENPVSGTWCEISPDSGRSWPISTNTHRLRQGCAAVNGQPVAYPDGTVVVPLGGFPETSCGPNYPPTVVVSEDSGVTWVERKMDNATIGQTEIDPDITITPDGTAYMLFRGKDQHTYMTRSPNKFVTWEGPWRVSPPDHTLNVFGSIVSGDDGRLAISYLGTSDAQQKLATPSNATGGTHWHAFVSFSLDANAATPTFYTQQVTPGEDPAQVGCIWLRGGPGGPLRCRNLLDFIDMVRDKDGRYFVAITDGCNPRNGCTGDTDAANYQSRDREAAVIIQDRGTSLFAQNGILPPYGLEPPKPFPR